ncbi:MAG: alpha/beta fold hydrolase [Nitrososphaerales archaeon]
MPTVTIDKTQLYYDDLGSGKALVFVHGACENSQFWNHQKILSDRYRVLMLDLPGHGKSKPFADGSVTLRRYSDLVASFMAKASLEKAIIVGHSMGGAIALANVIEHSENLMGAVLVSTGAKLGVLPSIREGLRSRFEETVKSVLGPRQFSSRTNLETIRFVTDEILKCKGEVATADFEACNGFDVRQKLQSINMPALMIVGEEDKLTPVTWSTYLKDNIPRSKLVIVRDSSHLPMLERPAEFNRHLCDFTDSI